MSAISNTQHILLSDDDMDDVNLFRDALDEIPLSTRLEIVTNGDLLLQRLNEINSKLPDVLFLDLNMPRKNGFECLIEIKKNENLKNLPVIVYSTSMEAEAVKRLYKIGAKYYIRKPNEYWHLKKVIHLALTLVAQPQLVQPSEKEFVLSQEIFQHEKQ